MKNNGGKNTAKVGLTVTVFTALLPSHPWKDPRKLSIS